MRDYSDYHTSKNEKILSDGDYLYNIALYGNEGEDVLINGLSKRVLIKNKYSEKDQLRTVYTKPNEVVAGDIIYYSDFNWITTNIEPTCDTYHKVYIQQCVSSLRWLNSSGKIKEAYFGIDFDSTNVGLEQDKYMILSNERRNILIQSNVDTVLLSKGKRFIFDNRVWKLTAINGLRNGIISMILEEDMESNANDRMDLRIADYTNNIHTYTVTIDNGDIAQINTGATLQITCTTTDTVGGSTSTTPLPVVYSSSNTSIATVDGVGLITAITDGTCVITAALQDDITVYDTINIAAVTVVQDNFAIAVNGSDICKVTQSQAYTISITNNGVVDNSKSVTWTLWDDTETTVTDLATITTSSGTTCTVKGNSVSPYKYGYCKLRATCIEDGTLIGTKRIQIKSLF